MRTYHAGRKALPVVAAVVAATVATVAAVAWQWWRPFRALVDGDSMRPALRPGDVVVATVRGRVRRGALVVVERPDRPGFELIKRVTASPGDVAPNGEVLGPGRYWVEGDDPIRSTDSRAFGSVRRDWIRGVVRFSPRARLP
jgi:signal peptidase I